MDKSPISAPTETIQTPYSDGVVRKPELLGRVVDRTGLKKRDVKPAVEAALAIIAEALGKGEELMLPPLGKLRVVKSKDIGSGASVLTLKLRTMKDGAGQGKSDLAQTDADD